MYIEKAAVGAVQRNTEDNEENLENNDLKKVDNFTDTVLSRWTSL